MVPFPLVNLTVMAFSSLSLSEGWPFLPAWSRGRQADRKSIPGGFTVRPACCCTQAGRQARQARLGRLNTVIISELCQPCPAYLLPARTSQPVIEHQHPRPTSLSLEFFIPGQKQSAWISIKMFPNSYLNADVAGG